MKRSEMKCLIRRCLTVIQNGIDEEDNPRFEMKNSLEAADFILDRIEKNGMLPPTYSKSLTEDERNEFGSDTVEFYFYTTNSNEWEPEDDE